MNMPLKGFSIGVAEPFAQWGATVRAPMRPVAQSPGLLVDPSEEGLQILSLVGAAGTYVPRFTQQADLNPSLDVYEERVTMLPSYTGQVPPWVPSWEQSQRDFVPDATLDDVTVEGTTAADWRDMLVAVDASEFPSQLFLNDVPTATIGVPLETLFAPEHQDSYKFYVYLGDNHLHCHFFEQQTISFDYDPYDVRDQEGVADLLLFVRLLSQTTGK